jgi:hypothetical protein
MYSLRLQYKMMIQKTKKKDDWSAASLACLTTPNCKQLQMASVRHMMLVWRMYTKYMSSPTPQMHSISLWTHLTIRDNTHPYPFVRRWCPGSDTPKSHCPLHQITDGVDLEDHQLAHILATSTCIEVGSAPVISADFVRHRVVTWMLNSWNSLFQSKKYIGSNFLTLYQRKDTPLVLTHVNSGPWMHKVGHSHSLIACLVCCIASYAPIGVFQSRFLPEESTACRCGFPMETMSHVLYWHLSHKWESEPKEQLWYAWLLEFFEANKSVFAFNIP